jgi:zinc transport system substrate-binding protein
MLRFLLLILSFFFFGPAMAGAAGVKVAVSIKPIHSLVSSLMQGIANPALVVSTAGSPHGYNLRPSEVRLLHSADLVIWVGPEFETFMAKVVGNNSKEQNLLTLAKDLPDLLLLPSREGGQWRTDHEHEDLDHAHQQTDPHIWLSPKNAAIIATGVAHRLAEIDPENRDSYKHNLSRFVARLQQLDQQLSTRLSLFQDREYFVFHDAYQYFENHFGLKPLGALAIDPNRRPGARRLTEIKKRIRQSAVQCIFTEPQFEPRLVQVLTEGTTLNTGILDPLGADLEPGPELYFNLMRQMATAIATCLPARE